MTTEILRNKLLDLESSAQPPKHEKTTCTWLLTMFGSPCFYHFLGQMSWLNHQKIWKSSIPPSQLVIMFVFFFFMRSCGASAWLFHRSFWATIWSSETVSVSISLQIHVDALYVFYDFMWTYSNDWISLGSLNRLNAILVTGILMKIERHLMEKCVTATVIATHWRF